MQQLQEFSTCCLFLPNKAERQKDDNYTLGSLAFWLFLCLPKSMTFQPSLADARAVWSAAGAVGFCAFKYFRVKLSLALVHARRPGRQPRSKGYPRRRPAPMAPGGGSVRDGGRMRCGVQSPATLFCVFQFGYFSFNFVSATGWYTVFVPHPCSSWPDVGDVGSRATSHQARN